MLKEIVIGCAVAVGALFVLATVAFLLFSLLPSPTARRLIKRWQGRQAAR
ncbi:hypothetical protein [Silvibacterium acidisoli]